MKRKCTQQVQVRKIVTNNNCLLVAYLSLQRGKQIYKQEQKSEKIEYYNQR